MIIQAKEMRETDLVAALAKKLWPDHDYDFLKDDFAKMLGQEDAALFLAMEEGTPAGFAHSQIRRDYVEGSETSPVGYLEGIYVEEAFRGRGIARSLVRACEAWSKQFGCTEFGSDCELWNTDSLHFHLSVGFTEANRTISFIRKI